MAGFDAEDDDVVFWDHSTEFCLAFE
jgi:hypothetical protein